MYTSPAFLTEKEIICRFQGVKLRLVGLLRDPKCFIQFPVLGTKSYEEMTAPLSPCVRMDLTEYEEPKEVLTNLEAKGCSETCNDDEKAFSHPFRNFCLIRRVVMIRPVIHP